MNFLLFQEEPIGIGVFLVIAVIGIAMIAVFAVWLWSLIDAIRSDFRGENDKLIWILVIVIGGILGSIIYIFVGRNQKV